VFDDPQLDALVAHALAHNRDLSMALDNVERARSLGRAETNALLPTGNATASAARRRLPAVERPIGQSQVIERIGAGLNVAWEADLFGRLRSAARAGRLEAEASSADAEALRSVLLADVAGAYFAWQGLQAQRTALTEIVAGQSQQVQLARARFELGATDELDLRRVQSELRVSEAWLAALQSELAQVASRIALLTGRFPSELALEVRDDTLTSARPLALGTPQWMLSQRPDVAAAEARLKAASARDDAAWAALLPRLTLGGSIGVLAGRGSDLTEFAARSWSLQPALTIPLLDLLQLAFLREARQAETRMALAAYEKSMLAAVADVEASAATYQGATERVRLLASRRDDAERALQIAEARYAAGGIDQLQLIDAQRTRRSAAIELAAAIAAHRIAVVELYRALGAPVS
jgi:NodT family efflux transporter outer membrane factor (OMF) lipoprotein